MEKEFTRTLAFLDVCINNKDPSCLITSVYHKKTFTRLLTKFFSFTSFSYKLGLIRTLLDRAYKINNTLLAFNEDVKKLSYTLKRHQFPEHLINKVIKAYLDRVNNSTTPCKDSDTTSDGICTLYLKLPYLVLSNFAQRKVRTLTKRYCRYLNIKLVFSSFKIKNLMNVKDTVPRSLRSSVVYKFNCAECNSAYVGERSRHLSTRVREHLCTDKNSNIFKHLKSSDKCKKACNDSCFTILDSASTYHQRKIKEALHILCERPVLNKQVQHFDVSLSF